LENFDLLAFRARDPVIVALEGGIAVLIGAAFVSLIGRRQMSRQFE
jgi:hypothetical protein